MKGTVTAQSEAILPLKLRGPLGMAQEFQVAIDTGFNDYLALTSDIIRTLGLKSFEGTTYLTADGTRVTAQYYAVHLEWFGVWMRIPVIEIEGGCFLGMGMLEGCVLSLEVIDGGKVFVEKLIAR